jgi:hypothetical protein
VVDTFVEPAAIVEGATVGRGWLGIVLRSEGTALVVGAVLVGGAISG